MTSLRAAAVALALLTALVLQPVVLNELPLPGAHPQLLLVVLAVVALVEGPGPGAVAGFSVGLLADLQSAHTVGLLALVMCLTGYLVGLVGDDAERSALVPLAVVATATVVSLALAEAVARVVGDGRLTPGELVRGVGAAALYDVLLTPFVFPLLRALLVRLDVERRP